MVEVLRCLDVGDEGHDALLSHDPWYEDPRTYDEGHHAILDDGVFSEPVLPLPVIEEVLPAGRVGLCKGLSVIEPTVARVEDPQGCVAVIVSVMPESKLKGNKG